MRRASVASALLIAIAACRPAPPEVIVINGEEMEVERIARADLFAQHPEIRTAMAEYTPDPQAIESLRAVSGRIEATVFLGTEYLGGESLVPAFLKLFETVDSGSVSIEFIVLHRDVPRERRVAFVETFIIRRDGRELGRIVERPAESMEQDVLRILSAN